MYKVCVVTATRAEYGLLRPIITKLDNSKDIRLMLVVTGTHLSNKYGYTIDEIERDKFDIDAKIDIGIDDGLSVSDIMAKALSEFGKYFGSTNPDMVVILGDRYEMLSVAAAATVSNIPIAHIHGGEITEGAIDDAIRHSITKMSFLHFTATERYRRRIIQMGENPERVFNVGAPGVENIKNLTPLPTDELEKSLGIRIADHKSIAVLTYHPETISDFKAEDQIEEIMHFMDMHNEIMFIVTGANSDKDGEKINGMLAEYCNKHIDHCRFFMSLGQVRYLSLLRHSNFVVGNSSSGIIEVPSFGIPTINIGDRQKGRDRANSIIESECKFEEIEKAYNKAKEIKGIKIVNPYEGNNTSQTIVNTIESFLSKGIDLRKSFYNID
ncbi:MAG: UDP-N-acetylglucosamine 2-epimerase (hydrolyzing) [Lachnospiraceae bacterium]|nr:UDP-N-acetylglucosamine 2-epimerase (hydrolyzing) [Lachnospiraceae bacterium]